MTGTGRPAHARQRSGQARPMAAPMFAPRLVRARRSNELWYPIHEDQHAHGLKPERRIQTHAFTQ